MTAWRNNERKAYGVISDTDRVVLGSLKEERGIATSNLITPYIFNFINLKSAPVEIKYLLGKTAGACLTSGSSPWSIHWNSP
ncbi:hypothetical protein [Paraburkholderia susongensis]|uniref:Uncharacterized protein n=1 Tax=Paraburkholderia susongensis TaxID=1515439 RepID=A0A1X7M4S1_9BURK|nr:hypothetical protein [Paraburkholderia susongensis]SMG61095.1 hypothetical protein SAMN06265784_11957 [Paraburkholderia susongensis]